MTDKRTLESVFPSAGEDLDAAEQTRTTPQTRSDSYRLAYNDKDFLLRDELRAVRLQLELLKPEILQRDNGIESTIVIFGSSRIPEQSVAAERLQKAETKARANPGDTSAARELKIARNIFSKTRYYDEARKIARIITEKSLHNEVHEHVVITGGGPGIMEAANRGASEAGGKSIGLNIVLPFEQQPNAYITPELCFQFHYFAIRKMHFLKRAKALIACPGGFGTLDELFETLTLIQTGKIKPVPVLLMGSEYWRTIIDFEALAEEGTIDETDLDIFQYVETAEEAWQAIEAFYS